MQNPGWIRQVRHYIQKKMKHLCFAFSLIIFPFALWSQSEPDYREMFAEAESFFLFEEYNEALPLYQKLHVQYTENDNINYKIGICYLNNPYEKEKAIGYLERAVENITLKYKENNFREKQAPLDALFYLGNAYRINNQFDKALEVYSEFKTRLDPEVYREQLVDEQIVACKNAKKLMKDPVDIDMTNIGERINTRFSDIRAVVSGDQTKMVFVSRLQFYDAVFYTEKVKGQWSYPRNIIPELGVDEDAYPTCLSFDGSELYVYRSDNFLGEIYMSTFENGKWTPLRKLNENINTKYWESHACLSPDGRILYFTSNRKGGHGGLDIYKSLKGKEGDWMDPINLGPVINTEYNEDTPFISGDGKTLYFSSYGHYNMGGYDIFYSALLEDSTWSVPLNAGYPINTSDDDLFFQPVRNGIYAYYSRYFEDQGQGKSDIYLVEIYSDTHPRKFLIRGILSLKGDFEIKKPLHIRLVNKRTGEIADTAILKELDTGDFSLAAPRGRYDLVISGDDIEDQITEFVIPERYREKEFEIASDIVLNKAVQPPEIPEPEIADRITVSDTLILTDDLKPVCIEMKLDTGSALVIESYHDSLLENTEVLDIQESDFTHTFKPREGKNLIKYKMISRDSTIISYKDVEVRAEPAEILAADTLPPEPPPPFCDVTGEQAEYESILSASLEDPPRRFLDKLKHFATGPLLEYLRGIDPDSLGIRNNARLVQHLINESARQAFEPEDIADILAVLAAGDTKDVDEFLGKLNASARGDLGEYLNGLDPGAAGIETVTGLVEHLMLAGEENGFSKTDAILLLTELASTRNMDETRQQMAELARGDLKTLLEQPIPEGIESISAFMDYLISESAHHDYRPEDVYALAGLMSAGNKIALARHLENLASLAGNDLRKAIQKINIEDPATGSLEQLYNKLLEEAEKTGYSRRDVDDLMIRYDRDLIYTDRLKKITAMAEGSLKEKLNEKGRQQKDLRDLIRFLSDAAPESPFSNSDVFAALTAILPGEMTPELMVTGLAKLARGDLKELISRIRPGASGIRTNARLAGYLLQLAGKEGIPDGEMQELLLRFHETTALKSLIDTYAPAAEGALAGFLMRTDPAAMNIVTLQELYDYLMENADEQGYSESDVMKFFLKLADIYGERSVYPATPAVPAVPEEVPPGKIPWGWLIAGAGITLLLLIIFRKRRKEEKTTNKTP